MWRPPQTTQFVGGGDNGDENFSEEKRWTQMDGGLYPGEKIAVLLC